MSTMRRFQDDFHKNGIYTINYCKFTDDLCLACEKHELTVPCGAYSYCSENNNVASCLCENGYEEVADSDEHSNNECQRIDPCNSVTCSTEKGR